MPDPSELTAPSSTTDASPPSNVRITVRPIGTPLPLGFFSFGLGNLLVVAWQMHWIPLAETRTMGLVLLGFAAPFQSFTGILGFLARDAAAGTSMFVFASSWIVTGLAMVATGNAQHVHVLAWYESGAAVVSLLLAVDAALSKPFLSTLLVLAAIRFGASAAFQFGAPHALSFIASAAGAVLVAFAFYGGVALLLEDMRHKPVLPVFRRGQARMAMTEGVDAQLANLAHEPGVREEL